jgi:hypothetical protein
MFLSAKLFQSIGDAGAVEYGAMTLLYSDRFYEVKLSS